MTRSRVDFEITGYEDLWNSKLEDKIATIASYRAVEGMVLLTMGKSMNEEDPTVIKEAGEKLVSSGSQYPYDSGYEYPECPVKRRGLCGYLIYIPGYCCVTGKIRI